MDMNEFNKPIIQEFRTNGGKVGGQFAGAPMILITTTGAKSGQSRTVPLVYVLDGARPCIIASFAGAPKDPPWFVNLVKNPLVEVELGTEKFKARAEVLGEPARTEMFNKMASMMSVFNEYQAKTTRTIPVVALNRI